MNKRASTAITTACVGMAVGTAAYMISASNGNGKAMKNKSKKLKKSTGKALRQVGDFIDNVSYMMR